MNRNSEGSFVASWKTLATISICLAIASLATLVTVVAINDVDLLSTVALTLAVIAFVAQLLIYIAQTAATSQQTAQSLAINTETKSLLTDIRARTGGTESVLKEQFSLVLEHALGKGLAQAGGLAEVVTQRIEAPSSRGPLLQQSQEVLDTTAEEAASSAVSRVLRRGDDDPILQILSRYPSEEDTVAAFKAFAGLSPLAFGRLVRHSSYEVLSRKIGREPFMTLIEPAPLMAELIKAGLSEEIEPIGIAGRRRRRTQLTPLGHIAASLFTADPPAPDHIFDENYQFRIVKGD